MAVNAYKENKNLQKLEDRINLADPDILLIMEVTEHLQLGLKDVFARYPYRLMTPVRDGFQIGLLSKSLLSDSNITYYGASETPLLRAKVKINGTEYSLYSAHPKPALSKKWYEERLSYFNIIEGVMNDDRDHKIMLGDFNSVPWENHFTQFLENTKMKSTLNDCGYKVTWPVYFLPMGIPMDHVLVSNDVEYKDLKVGPSCGSDHYPMSINVE